VSGGFIQPGPRLGNQYRDDAVLRAFLAWRMPAEVLAGVEAHLEHLGERARGDFLAMAAEAEAHPPVLRPYDAWGRRIDEIAVSAGWRALERAAAQEGLVAAAYERRQGPWSRLYQGSLAYLFHASSAYFSCPLAMTDGAARLFEVHGSGPLREEVLRHLTSRDPDEFWTSGQWMTEKIGGSDVSATQTVARPRPDGACELYGDKWFSSATTAQMAMTLARIEGDPPGNRGLSLFFVKTRRPDGGLNGITIHRLKDKLGTRALPTAELGLSGTEARPVGERGRGVPLIATLFNVTRLWNAVCAVAAMRRAYALARDYADRRQAFGRRLIDHPLHARTLEDLDCEIWGSTFLTLHLLGLQGLDEAGEADAGCRLLLRILTPIAKLYTAKQALGVVSECLESLGGAGYVEDNGLGRLLRDTQVLSIWEGTTNVLSLDVLRAMRREGAGEALEQDVSARLAAVRDPGLGAARARLLERWSTCRATLSGLDAEPDAGQQRARSLAFELARIYAASLLLEYLQAVPQPRAAPLLRFWTGAG